MAKSSDQLEFRMPERHPSQPADPSGLQCKLAIILEAAPRGICLEWSATESDAVIDRVRVCYNPHDLGLHAALWLIETGAGSEERLSSGHPSAIRAKLKAFNQRRPVDEAQIFAFRAATWPDGSAAGLQPVILPADVPPWVWLARQISAMLQEEEGRLQSRAMEPPRADDPEEVIAARKLNELRAGFSQSRYSLEVRLNYRDGRIDLEWFRPGASTPEVCVNVECSGMNELTWTRSSASGARHFVTSHNRLAIRKQLERLQREFNVADGDMTASAVLPKNVPENARAAGHARWEPGSCRWAWLENEIKSMAEQLRVGFSPLAKLLDDLVIGQGSFHDSHRLEKLERRREEEEARRRAAQQAIEEKRRRRQQARQQREAARAARASDQPARRQPSPASPLSPQQREPVPPVPVTVAMPEFSFQDTFFALPDLHSYFLREKAAQWWVSNQSDNLLCLPYCRIERLEYQLRTALRALGPLRGRALLSDEVGLGKTIEAGLVLKELLTRGMVKRFLILTVPSLVDQWEEELAEKFSVEVATTNQAAFRSGPKAFWRESRGIVASLHTLKQPAHLAVAQAVNWDLLVVDEAHYLRNRASQAWQAVNALPRQFLLLLTATPVQNSLEELYNLVTLLQPGQLPSPKEFRARFVDPKRPHQPREPDELRRLLGQVMIRNTRANAGINLPPRRAETVSFEPGADERAFWSKWETALREQLSTLSASQGNLWGRLLLQTAGSSPAAWRDALKSFPARDAAKEWSAQAPLDASWEKKCELLLPLTRGEGGVVIFTQFLQTQAALAERLRQAGVQTFVINGQTPAEQRHPMTEDFRKRSGALLLTHSGTEGRNLQFCHRLVNFDLPWNPMEIEQRIGRLHRLGQQHPVRIYNFVQTGTLQEHLLHILQEKLNLFELVVGETGLILGDRFSSDEFAEEVLRRWRESDGRVAEAMQELGHELATARESYEEVKQLDETLFAKDYESL